MAVVTKEMLIVGGGLLALALVAKAVMGSSGGSGNVKSIDLYAGFNDLVYDGLDGINGMTFLSSIKPYLTAAYYLSQGIQWIQITDSTIVHTGYEITIGVENDCVLTYPI
ncbi:MAG: hypothetical protein PHC43_00080 [Candidatus Marinimicrobia bacterium]|jgi:hypothetical protein|nr:hypothetical protein [Candidatus Neomarinimicrobiota bacterium]